MIPGFSAGNIAVLVAVVAAIWRIEMLLRTLFRKLDWFMMEHEMLVLDYCRRNNIDVGDLPTRFKHRF